MQYSPSSQSLLSRQSSPSSLAPPHISDVAEETPVDPWEKPAAEPSEKAPAAQPASDGSVEYDAVDDATFRVFTIGAVGLGTFEFRDQEINFAITAFGHGTGFGVSAGGLILSAQHVVDGPHHVVVRHPGKGGFSGCGPGGHRGRAAAVMTDSCLSPEPTLDRFAIDVLTSMNARSRSCSLLRLRTEAELLAAISLTEAALLAGWKHAITEGASTVSIPPPWSITYHDGSGNGYRLWQDDAVAHFEYTPVTPAMSSSGTYSGGAPARGDLTAAQVRELWTTIDALARETALHASVRAKGTGTFTATTSTASSTFLIRSSDQLRELDTALARIRLP